MNIIKGIAALLIFGIILAGAWKLDQSLKLEHRTIRYIEQLVENPHINNIDEYIPGHGDPHNTDNLIMQKVPHHDPFNPREYIRIRRKTLESNNGS